MAGADDATWDHGALAGAVRDYRWLSRAAPNRLSVSTFFAGFTLAAFVGLFTVAPELHHLDASGIVLLAAEALIAASTLLFIFTAMATYVCMQRLAELSVAAVDALTSDDGRPLGDRDQRLLREAVAIYREPAPFIVWGLLLVVAGILLIARHVYPALFAVLAAVTGLILIRTRALHGALRQVLPGRAGQLEHRRDR